MGRYPERHGPSRHGLHPYHWRSPHLSARKWHPCLPVDHGYRRGQSKRRWWSDPIPCGLHPPDRSCLHPLHPSQNRTPARHRIFPDRSRLLHGQLPHRHCPKLRHPAGHLPCGPLVDKTSVIPGTGNPVDEFLLFASQPRAYFRVRSFTTPPATPANLGSNP